MRTALPAGLLLAALYHLAQPAIGQNTTGLPLSGAGTIRQIEREDILSSVVTSATPYRLSDNKRVVLIDFPSLYEQGRMLGRVVLFVERHGTPKTRVMTQDEVQQWLDQHAQRLDTLTVGNNFRASQLARFFNTARMQQEELTGDERQLRDWLLQAGLLQQTDDGLAAVEPETVVVTVPQASTVTGCNVCTVKEAHRKVILEHELSHARFATDTSYREYVISFWSRLTELEAGGKFAQFLRKRGYNAEDQELLANEMQAFLMHTPDARMFAAAALGMNDAELDDIRRSFNAGWEALAAAGK